jgi:hypothetical protein
VRAKAPHSPYRNKVGVIERFTASQKSVCVKFSGVVEAKRVLMAWGRSPRPCLSFDRTP